MHAIIVHTKARIPNTTDCRRKEMNEAKERMCLTMKTKEKSDTIACCTCRCEIAACNALDNIKNRLCYWKWFNARQLIIMLIVFVL